MTFSQGVATAIAIVVFVLILILNPFVMISAGERGVVLNWGAVSNDVLGEGIHWRVPIQQQVKMMNVKTVKAETEAIAYSKDTQTVDSKIAINYHLDPNKVNTIYQTIGDNKTIENTLIQPIIKEVFKGIVAKYSAGELLEKREEASAGIKDGLVAKLQEKNVIMENVSIINFDFSDAYEAANEAKQVQQANVLTAQNKLEQVKIEAEQKVATARAEAEAIKIQAEAVTQQGGSDYVQLQAIKQWDGKLPTSMIPGGTVPFINLNK